MTLFVLTTSTGVISICPVQHEYKVLVELCVVSASENVKFDCTGRCESSASDRNSRDYGVGIKDKRCVLAAGTNAVAALCRFGDHRCTWRGAPSGPSLQQSVIVSTNDHIDSRDGDQTNTTHVVAMLLVTLCKIFALNTKLGSNIRVSLYHRLSSLGGRIARLYQVIRFDCTFQLVSGMLPESLVHAFKILLSLRVGGERCAEQKQSAYQQRQVEHGATNPTKRDCNFAVRLSFTTCPCCSCLLAIILTSTQLHRMQRC